MNEELFIKYLICLKIIQPARVQDVIKYYFEFWGDKDKKINKDTLTDVHEYLKNNNMLVTVRLGTYIASMKAVMLVHEFVDNKTLDNRRLFLLKKQRRLYSN